MYGKSRFSKKRNSYTDFCFHSNGLTDNLEQRKASGLTRNPRKVKIEAISDINA